MLTEANIGESCITPSNTWIGGGVFKQFLRSYAYLMLPIAKNMVPGIILSFRLHQNQFWKTYKIQGFFF